MLAFGGGEGFDGGVLEGFEVEGGGLCWDQVWAGWVRGWAWLRRVRVRLRLARGRQALKMQAGADCAEQLRGPRLRCETVAATRCRG